MEVKTLMEQKSFPMLKYEQCIGTLELPKVW